MNKEELSEVVAKMMADGTVDARKLFKIKTVPTVEGYSNIGFEGLQELADTFRKEGRKHHSDGDEDSTLSSMNDANKCEALFDKYNGMSTLKVDVGEIMSDCGDMLTDLFSTFVFMASQGVDEGGMFFEFVLGPTMDEMGAALGKVCDCEACTAQRAASNIPKDQLN